MFKVLRDAWKVPDIRKKILFTILMLGVYRLGCYVPVPGINVEYIRQAVGQYELLGFMNELTGGALGNLTIFALGIIPYINASIIMNLLTVAIPALERMAKEGEDGQKKVAAITRYAAVALGLITSAGIVFGLGPDAVINQSWFSYAVILLCLTAGTALIMWIGEKITDKGIGNGISLIIFISIISRLPGSVYNAINGLITGQETISIFSMVLLIAAAVLIIGGITFVDMGERRIPVQYAKKVVGRKVYGGQSTFIPMKLNSSGVLPLIFAMTLVSFPGMIANFWPQSEFYIWYKTNLGQGTVLYSVVYALLILFFTFFYTTISFNPIEVSKNMQQNGGFIPGIRPGKPTSDYLKKILNRITLFGAVFLALVAAVPTMFTGAGLTNMFSATSLLIAVNVSLETTKQLESQMLMRHYKGFLK